MRSCWCWPHAIQVQFRFCQVLQTRPAKQQRLLCGFEEFTFCGCPAMLEDKLGEALRIYHSSQFSIIRKFAESAIHTIVQIIYEDIEQNRPQDRPLGHST
ncbi:unnamed protein product [Eretmochelys imbricata]